MIDQVVLSAWSLFVGLDAAVQAMGDKRTAAADRLLSELATIEDGDQLRNRLAFGKHGPDASRDPKADDERKAAIDDLVLLLVSECVRLAATGGPASDGLNFVAWVELVAPFGTDGAIYAAHAKMLCGLFEQENELAVQAERSFQEALQDYNELPGDHAGPCSICRFCLAVVAVDGADFAPARALFEQALQVPDLDQSWAAHIHAEQSRLEEQEALVHALSEATSAQQVQQIARSNPQADYTRTIRMIDRLALAAGVRHDSSGAVALASVADWLAGDVGEAHQSRAHMVEIAQHLNDHATAEALLRTLQRDDPSSASLREQIGREVMLQGRSDEAIQLFMELIQDEPHQSGALRDLGGLYLERSDFDTARRYLEAAIAADPNDALAATLLKQLPAASRPGIIVDRESKKIFISEELLSDPSDNVSTMLTAAMLGVLPDDAKASALESIAADKGADYAQRIAALLAPNAPPRPQSAFGKAEDLFSAGRLSEALEEYLHAIAEDRADARAYMGAGDCYFRMGKMNLAAAYFEESVAINPDRSTYRFLGDAYGRLGRLEMAADAYEHALEIDPTYDAARAQLRMLREHMKNAN